MRRGILCNNYESVLKQAVYIKQKSVCRQIRHPVNFTKFRSSFEISLIRSGGLYRKILSIFKIPALVLSVVCEMKFVIIPCEEIEFSFYFFQMQATNVTY